MAESRMVAVCDVLGFKNLINSKPLEQVGGAMVHLRRMLTYAILHNDPKNAPPTMVELREKAEVGIAIFSDTIFLYAKDDTDEGMHRVIESVGWLLFGTLTTSIVGLRGGLAYGEVQIEPENDLFIGKPIVDAHLMEQAQVWSGATLCDTAVDRVDLAGWKVEDLPWLTSYPVPIKGQPSTKRIAVDWTFGVHLPLTYQWSPSSVEPSAEDEVQRPDVVAKYRNTKAFHSNMCRFCK